MNENQIVSLIQTIIYLLPVLGIVWKASQLSSRIAESEKDINNIEGNLDKWQDKMDSKLAEIDASINSLNVVMSRIEARFTTLFESMEKNK
jgi:peptidoglycan hydrolase CwlO-like protein